MHCNTGSSFLFLRLVRCVYDRATLHNIQFRTKLNHHMQGIDGNSDVESHVKVRKFGCVMMVVILCFRSVLNFLNPEQ